MVNIIELYTSTKDKKDLITNLQNNGLIPESNEYKCPNCDNNLEICELSSCPDGYAWRCRAMVSTSKKCETRISIRTGIFFENSKMPIPQVCYYLLTVSSF